eukprot:gene6961-7701_t
MEEEIRQIHELELAAIDDIKNINNIKTIYQTVTNDDKAKKVRIAAIHSLRRLYVDYLENNKLATLKPNEAATTKLKKWFNTQYNQFIDMLCKALSSVETDWLHALSIRTLLELLKWDVAIREDEEIQGIRFGLVTYRALFQALINGGEEVDVDLLLLLKDEVFQYHDCAYFGLSLLKELTEELKEDIKEVSSGPSTDLVKRMKNVLDILRVIPFSDEVPEDEEFFLPPPAPTSDESAGQNKKVLDDDASSDEEEAAGKKKKEGVKTNKRGASSILLKSKKRPRLSNNSSIGTKLRSVDHYREVFSQTWLLVLSLPFSAADQKVILKHLPQHVMPYLANPLLLADYLTRSYDLGGIVAILALESLFQLIVEHNLDYPNFFLSIYKLCTVSVFNAKYHGKFLKLLHMSLRSANLPAYLVASFIKRLAGLALQCSAPLGHFCVLQIQWLMRHHQQCLTLLHREKKSESPSGSDFDITEEQDLEKAHALDSSLWELEALEQHYLFDLAKLSASFRDVESTNPLALPVVIDEAVIGKTYGTLIEHDLEKKKKLNVAMNYKKPQTFCGENSLVRKLFG